MDYSIMYAELDRGSLKYGEYCRFCGEKAVELNDEWYDLGLYCSCEGATRNEELTVDIRKIKRELKQYEDELELLRYKSNIGLVYDIPVAMTVGGSISTVRECLGCGKTAHKHDRGGYYCSCEFAEAYCDDSISCIDKTSMIEQLHERYSRNYKLVMNSIYGGIKND